MSPQTRDEKLSSPGNGARTIGDRGPGTGSHDRLYAIAANYHGSVDLSG